MLRNLRSIQQLIINSTPKEEVNQINPQGGNGNSEGSSNTFNRAIQVPLRGNSNNNNNLSNKLNTIIKAQVTTTQAIEQTLQVKVKAL